jgi:hypothetical protein
MDRHHPDFIVIGAMKCATTTLHEQLALQPGIFMSTPKEPNFFSDDPVYARGLSWYASLFAGAEDGALRGESSTHYTKLPTHPRTVERLRDALPDVKLIYVMRHPVERLVSHYVHQLSLGERYASVEEAIEARPELVEYGLYSRQLRPYLDTYGPENVLPIFFRRLTTRSQQELERVCRFIGYEGHPAWESGLKPQNVGKERLRKSTLRQLLVSSQLLGTIRKKLVPRSLTERIKAMWRIRYEAPVLTPELNERLVETFDSDLAELGSWLGVRLSCANFNQLTASDPLEWTLTPEPSLAR